jgi:hypothetical protein
MIGDAKGKAPLEATPLVDGKYDENVQLATKGVFIWLKVTETKAPRLLPWSFSD